MAGELKLDGMELYLFGMVSVVRSTLNLTASDLEETLRLRPEMIAAFSGADNKYHTLLELTNSFEAGAWEKFSAAAEALLLSEDRVATACTRARQWAEEILAVL